MFTVCTFYQFTIGIEYIIKLPAISCRYMQYIYFYCMSLPYGADGGALISEIETGGRGLGGWPSAGGC